MEVVVSSTGAVIDPMDFKVSEVLKEVQLDYESPIITKFIDETISSIKKVINKIPQDLKVGSDLASGFIRDVNADKFEFSFKKPASIEIGGSYSIQALTKPSTSIDLFISLPKECFHEKDYLNHRYHAKRCLYLCIIKKYLNASSKIKKIEWSTFQNEARKPVLVVYPVQELDEIIPGFFIRLIPTATSLFSVPKLNLARSNVRALNKEGMALQATPRYCSSILEDMFLEENAEFVRKTFLGWKELREALILIKVWARQRTSIYSHDCLNGFLISVILSYLATASGGNRVKKSMKTVQIFRVTLDFIANSKLWDKGLLLQPHNQSNLSKEERKQYQQLFPVVLCDSSSQLNLAFRITKHGFSELRDEAAQTLSCIDKYRDGGFEEVFMTKVDFAAKYDYCIRIKADESKEVYASGFCLDEECWRTYEEKVHSLLEQALGDRAKSIRVTWRSCPSQWKIEEGFSEFSTSPLVVGILTSAPEKSFRGVDVGPNAENKEEALKYRKFWGEKAELRRFKDGIIAESTVWECQHWERHLIIKRICDYILSRHLALPEEKITCVAEQLDFCLLHGGKDSVSFHGSLLAAFEVLSKRLRSIKDIPLSVSSVQPLDPAFRSTSVFLPAPHPLANEKVKGRTSQLPSTCIQPVEVMIQLEGSGNWPMDDVAIEKTKHAFLLQIGDSLQKSWGSRCIASEDEVDVLMSGYAFRLRILHERGLSLVRKKVGNERMKRITSGDKELFIRGQHSSMINGLLGRYPVYGPVVRLAKRWISAHLFSSFVEEEAVELLVAYLFLRHLPFYAPSSRITGFLRFLRLLSNYDWTFSPLIVDINGDMTSKDEKEIYENFMTSRKAYEESPQNLDRSMFLATSYDKSSEAWTKYSPNSSELKRMVAYAKTGAELLTDLIVHDQTDAQKTWKSLFRTPLNLYDAVILLHRHKLAFPQRLLSRPETVPGEMIKAKHVAEGKASKYFDPFMLRGDLEEMKKNLMVNFDPVRCLVNDLKEEFSETFKLWYDSVGGDAIGLTWDKLDSKKRAREEMDEDENDKRQDPIDVLRNVGEVGRGFVRSVYLFKSPRLQN
ncbi:nucleolar protein 6-like isoform X1 [Papaver somniferum]|uniref:nucleolar protein 6-like isoform X1 n=1 Tax=Papaver somniferum TaxID=3469 RepID=UPI000E702F31|nr:nucleolar protein 6-like isoform X1 [Papaver somniferum]